jgi:hypothetical protein
MSASAGTLAELIQTIESPQAADREAAAQALAFVRDGVLTGEGPTTAGRVHFSRLLDSDDAAWCARILMAAPVDHLPVSRAEADAMFQIHDAATERTDGGRFDDLLAKSVVHHAASASGLSVPPRAVALAPETPIESWAPTAALDMNIEMLQWIAGRMRGKRHNNRMLSKLVASLIGAAASLPLAQSIGSMLDLGL